MKFTSLYGYEVKVNLVRASKSKRNMHTSKFQKSARRILKERFSGLDIYEDLYIDGMFLDFFIPAIKLVIEIDGCQHEIFNKFFHKDGAGFARGILRDEWKAAFCLLNKLIFVRVPASDALDENRLMEIIHDELER